MNSSISNELYRIFGAWMSHLPKNVSPLDRWTAVIEELIELLYPWTKFPNRFSLGDLLAWADFRSVNSSPSDVGVERLKDGDFQLHWFSKFFTGDGYDFELMSSPKQVKRYCGNPLGFAPTERIFWGLDGRGDKPWTKVAIYIDRGNIITRVIVSSLTTREFLDGLRENSFVDSEGCEVLQRIIQNVVIPWKERRAEQAEEAAATSAILETFQMNATRLWEAQSKFTTDH